MHKSQHIYPFSSSPSRSLLPLIHLSFPSISFETFTKMAAASALNAGKLFNLSGAVALVTGGGRCL